MILLSFLIGLIIAFSIPKEYITHIRLVPEIEDYSQKNSLGTQVGVTGVSLSSTYGVDAILPDLYPDVVRSTPFLLGLLDTEINNESQKLSLYSYLLDCQKSTWWSSLIQLPSKGLKWMRDVFSDEKDLLTIESNQLYFTEDDEMVLVCLRERLHASMDKKSSVISVSVRMQDPIVAAMVGQAVLEQLQEYITSYRTQKARQDMEFTELLYKEAQTKYFQIQRLCASYEDANKNIISSAYKTERERLHNEMQVAFNVYSSLAQKLEENRLRVQAQTPVYTILEPVKVPVRAISPNKLFILFSTIIVSLVFIVSYILFPVLALRLKNRKPKI